MVDTVDRIPIEQVRVEVIPSEPGPAGNAQKGELFEFLVSRLMDRLGFERPERQSLRHTSSGIELDVVAQRKLGSQLGIAECKAYSANVHARELQTFYGKLQTERFDRSDCEGFFFALPGLTPQGREQARKIQDHDSKFKYVDASAVVQLLKEDELIGPWEQDGRLTSDPMVIVTEHGIHQACLELDRQNRSAIALLVWGRQPVPNPVLEALKSSSVSRSLPVQDRNGQLHPPDSTNQPLVINVAHSREEFDYHLPTSPEFFVGRQPEIQSTLEVLEDDQVHCFVINAKSGSGKSSFALKLAAEIRLNGGVAAVLDGRTATHPGYVPAALQRVCKDAEEQGLLRLPRDMAFGGVGSSLNTIARSDWTSALRPALVVFDQFESVFRDAQVARVFRDLAIAIHDLDKPFKIGFAWKTDLVDWTEAHPFQLREDIRSVSRVITLSPFRAADVSTVLDRLGRSIDQRLSAEMRNRLREDSGGFPWLLKKLSSHVHDQLRSGRSQEDLLADGLSVQSLFERDLEQLDPAETSLLRSIAKIAPVSSSDADISATPAVLQSLLDRRLLIQIGDKLDIYWDTFSDYLNTGGSPVKDGYLLRLRPGPSAQLLMRKLMETGKPLPIDTTAKQIDVSHRTLHNVSRELHLLGLLDFRGGVVQTASAARGADNPEVAFREIANRSLRQHRAYDVLKQSFANRGTPISASYFADQLAESFVAVKASQRSWLSYGRAFAQWFAYAGIATLESDQLIDAPPTSPPALLTGPIRMRGNRPAPRSYPRASGKACAEAASLIAEGKLPDLSKETVKRAVLTLQDLDLVELRDGIPKLHPDQRAVTDMGAFDPNELRLRIESTYPGAAQVFSLLEQRPDASADEVGAAMRSSQNAAWSKSSTGNIGRHMRSFAKAVGIATPDRRSKTTPSGPKTAETPPNQAT